MRAVGAAQPPGPLQVAVVAGPDLAGAVEEARAVAGLYDHPLMLTGSSATVHAVSAAIDGADLVHIAAHGRLRSDNPLFSALLMVDGPLTVHDLERLGRAPQQMVLAACNAGISHVTGADEMLGLATALLSQGTVSLIAPVNQVDDAETIAVMVRYHRERTAGRPPSESLAAAQLGVGAVGSAAWAAAASFICLGAGSRRAPLRAAPPTTGSGSVLSVIPEHFQRHVSQLAAARQ